MSSYIALQSDDSAVPSSKDWIASPPIRREAREQILMGVFATSGI